MVHPQTPSMHIVRLTLQLCCCRDPGSCGYFTDGIVTVAPSHIPAQSAMRTNAVSRKDET